ncbi:MAG: alpha-glucosidase [Actinomycetota bacterium]|nr:alpha-glucosidase [Actinomycetota bacterium]
MTEPQTAMTAATEPARAGGEWWRNAVIYQIYIRSFADSDGDGIGDLPGIRSRLPYLRDLGVDAIWITPFYPSPMADGGYDVADYRDVEPLFGQLADAEALITEAHGMGLRVLVDIVPNHSSDQHVWFQAALAAGPGSPERARYVFRQGRGPAGAEPPNDWQSTFGGSAWTRLPDGAWYLHLFAPEQPDLNWEHPEVVADFHDTLRFWLDRGVDGFRIDVANSLKKDQSFPDLGDMDAELLDTHSGPRHPIWDRDEVHEIYRGWRRVLDEYDGERAFVAEAWVTDPQRLAMYVRPDELHTAFNFQYLRAPWEAAALRSTIDECLATTHAVGAPTTWVLSNHDVTRHATRYGRLDHTGGGVAEGERVRPDTPLDLSLGRQRARAATLLTLALPGSTYLYQGEELGLEEVVDLPESVLQDPIWERTHHAERGRDGCRVPIPWTPDGPSLGFGSGGPWLPQPADWAQRSVAAQQGAEGSTLELYRAALALRRAEPAFGEGDMSWQPSPDDTLLFERSDAASGSRVVCAVNLGESAVPLPSYGKVLLASGPLGPQAELPPDTTVWLRV